VRAGLTVFVLYDFYHLLAISCQPGLVLKESRVCEKDYLGLIQVDLSSLVKLSRLYHISTLVCTRVGLDGGQYSGVDGDKLFYDETRAAPVLREGDVDKH